MGSILIPLSFKLSLSVRIILVQNASKKTGQEITPKPGYSYRNWKPHVDSDLGAYSMQYVREGEGTNFKQSRKHVCIR